MDDQLKQQLLNLKKREYTLEEKFIRSAVPYLAPPNDSKEFFTEAGNYYYAKSRKEDNLHAYESNFIRADFNLKTMFGFFRLFPDSSAYITWTSNGCSSICRTIEWIAYPFQPTIREIIKFMYKHDIRFFNSDVEKRIYKVANRMWNGINVQKIVTFDKKIIRPYPVTNS